MEKPLHWSFNSSAGQTENPTHRQRSHGLSPGMPPKAGAKGLGRWRQMVVMDGAIAVAKFLPRIYCFCCWYVFCFWMFWLLASSWCSWGGGCLERITSWKRLTNAHLCNSNCFEKDIFKAMMMSKRLKEKRRLNLFYKCFVLWQGGFTFSES